MTYLDNFLKTYPAESVNYVFTTTVKHRGTVIAFAMNDQRRIFYTVLSLEQASEKKNPIDVNYWSETPKELFFSNEIGQVGAGIAGATQMPMVKKGGQVEADPRTVRMNELDLYLSSTGRLTAAAPFVVLSDEKHIYVFRQAIGASDTDMVFKLSNGGASGDTNNPNLIKDSGANVPLVNSTLLMDRFMLSGEQLTPKREVRFRRSRHKDRPQGQKDTLGAKDMNGIPFFEPTLELDFVQGLSDGRFTVFLLPTQVAGIQRWQIVSFNETSNSLEFVNVEKSKDGLFNTRGTRFSGNDSSVTPNESPGVRRSYLQLQNCGAVTGVAAQLYYQQEEDETGKTLKQNGRVLFALSTAALSQDKKPHLVALDMAVTNGGGLVDTPSTPTQLHTINLSLIDQASAVDATKTAEQLAAKRQTEGQKIAKLQGELTQLNTDVVYYTAVQKRLETLERSLRWRAENGATFYADPNYTGKKIRLTLAGEKYISNLETRTDDNFSKNWKDEISSVSVGSGIEAHLWQWKDRSGFHDVLTSSAGTLGHDDDHISIEVRESASLTNDIRNASQAISGDLAVLSAAFNTNYQSSGQRMEDLATVRAELKAIKKKIAAWSKKQVATNFKLSAAQRRFAQIGTVNLSDVKMSMPVVYIDHHGLTMTGGILGFAWSKQAPALLDSGQGQIALYFKGEKGEYFSAYYDAVCKRGRFASKLSSGLGKLAMTLRSAEIDAADPKFSIHISDGSYPDLCNVNILQQVGLSEMWADVPRSAADFASVLNGENAQPVFVAKGTVLPSGDMVLTTSPQQPLFGEATLLINGDRLRLSGMSRNAEKGYEALLFEGQTNFETNAIEITGVESITTAQTSIQLQSPTSHIIPAGLSLEIGKMQVMVRERAIVGATEIKIHPVHPEKLANLAGKKIYALPHDGITNREVSTFASSSSDGSERFFVKFISPSAASEQKKHNLSKDDILQIGSTLARVEVQVEENLFELKNLSNSGGQPSGEIKKLEEISVFWLPYDYEKNAILLQSFDPNVGPEAVGRLNNGSVLVATSIERGTQASQTESEVKNGSLALIIPDPHAPRWVGNAPGQTLLFGPGGGGVTLADAGRLSNLDTQGDIGLEMWVKSSNVGVAAGLDKQQLIYHHSDKSRYGLGLSRTFEQKAFDFENKYACQLPDMTLDLTRGVTLEGWVKINDRGCTLFDLGNPATPPYGIYTRKDRILLEFDTSNSFQLSSSDSNGAKTVNLSYTLSSQADVFPTTKWNHVAVTFQPESSGSGGLCTLYINGEKKHEARTSSYPFTDVKIRKQSFLGYRGSEWTTSGSSFFAEMDELRMWDTAQSENSIKLNFSRRAQPDDVHLIACWRFQKGSLENPRYGLTALDIGRNKYHGKVMTATPVWSSNFYSDQLADLFYSPTLKTSPFYGYSITAGVGQAVNGALTDTWVESAEGCIEFDEWHHIGAMYNQSYALKFNGENSYLKAPHASSLNISQDLTIEAFVQVDQLGTAQGIVSKGNLQAEQNQEAPYAFSVTAGGELKIAFEDQGGGYHEFLSNKKIKAGQLHKIAVVRAKGQDTVEHKKQMSSEEKKKLGMDESKPLEMVENVEVKKWHQITFYIDGVAAGSGRYASDDIGNNEQPVTIGRVRKGLDTLRFTGTMSELRIWSRPIEFEKIGKRIRGNEKGLTAWWRMDDNQGSVATDEKEGHHATLNGSIKWVNSPDTSKTGSQWQLYKDGNPVQTKSLASAPIAWGDKTFSLGSAGSTNPFLGQLEEVRVWKNPRTQEQILDNLFTRLKGEKSDLIAYYTFDPDYADMQGVLDAGLRGSRLNINANASFEFSEAPIGVDTAEVRSAISGFRTRFNGALDGTPAAEEYGDMQYDFDGNAIGVLKRCYSYLKDGAWHLVTGYKVGNLVTEWIGQAQFSPQIMGYVEGAPPVPSENLTAGPKNPASSDYTNASSLTVKEAEEVTYTFSRSNEKGMDAAFEASFGMGISGEIEIVTAPLGVGVSVKPIELSLMNNLKGNFNASQSWTSEDKVGVGRNTNKDLSVGLSGNWEAIDRPLNRAIGRRYQPANMGFALVQSETADVFALRMAHSGALVAYRFMPNPDIPADVNIVPFPINPRYTKQGTLDGGIGFNERGKVLDPDYPTAGGYGQHSYFKPKEAYALKKQIEREEQQLKSYYENYGASPSSTAGIVGGALGAAGAVATLLPGGMGAAGAIMGGTALASGLTTLAEAVKADKSPTDQFAKRNLVNTYVWTADGGFYAESTQLSEVKQEVVGGNYNISGGVSGSTAFEAKAAATVSFGMQGTMGGHYAVTKTKSKEAKVSFSVDVSIDVPGDLQAYDKQQNRVYDIAGAPVNVPGKVDAYRFMTFYMASDHNNFDDLFSRVVDPIWLEQSTHPNAAAMRQAQQKDKKPPCWRVFHRVTFVSRLLPDFPIAASPPLPQKMKQINIDSNWMLLQRLEPHVKQHTGNPVEFRDAVRRTVEVYMAELIPYTVEIIDLAMNYFGVVDG
ncbi:MAG: LamG-like jellyroll fold domain-containing protein [Anaerolineae bacterium]